MKKALIVLGFPAVGKTYFTEKNKELRCLDSSMLDFAWIRMENTKKRDPEFPKNYIEYIKNNELKYDIIFVDIYEILTNDFVDKEFNVVFVVPSELDKKHWLQKMKDGGYDEKLVNLMDSNWEDWLDNIDDWACENDAPMIILNRNEFLSDRVDSLIFYKNQDEFYKRLPRKLDKFISKLLKENNINKSNLDYPDIFEDIEYYLHEYLSTTDLSLYK